LLETARDDFLRPWRHYADFSGRASRAEYWTFTLGAASINLALLWISDALELPFILGDYGPLELAFMIAVVVPGTAVTARRLHDVNKSGWWQLIAIIPLLGGLILFFDLIGRPTRGANRYGSNPYGDPVVVVSEDGGAPWAISTGRFSECPHCSQRNPKGRTVCQWCHQAYREGDPPV